MIGTPLDLARRVVALVVLGAVVLAGLVVAVEVVVAHAWPDRSVVDRNLLADRLTTVTVDGLRVTAAVLALIALAVLLLALVRHQGRPTRRAIIVDVRAGVADGSTAKPTATRRARRHRAVDRALLLVTAAAAGAAAVALAVTSERIPDEASTVDLRQRWDLDRITTDGRWWIAGAIGLGVAVLAGVLLARQVSPTRVRRGAALPIEGVDLVPEAELVMSGDAAATSLELALASADEVRSVDVLAVDLSRHPVRTEATLEVPRLGAAVDPIDRDEIQGVLEEIVEAWRTALGVTAVVGVIHVEGATER